MQKAAERRTSLLDVPLTQAVSINWEVVLYGLFIAFALVTRFWDLGSRAQHHDESMHAYYSWNLYRGEGYEHNPLLHGPFLYHFAALIYFLFGASDYTSRVGPAIFGLAIVIMPCFLRRWLGRRGALLASGMLAISPSFLYFSRFIRMDIFAAGWTLLMVIGIWKYLDERRGRWLYVTAAAMAFLFSTKEVAFIHAFIFGSFLFLLVAYRWWFELRRTTKGSPPRGPSQIWGARGDVLAALREQAAFDLVIALGTLLFPLTSAFVIRAVGWDPLDYGPQGIQRSGIILLVMWIISGLVGLWWDRRRWLATAAVYYAIFFLLHTTFLTNMKGFATGMVGSLGYWLAQQGVRRGTQPWYYYLILLPLYEFLPALCAGLGTLTYLIRGLPRRPPSVPPKAGREGPPLVPPKAGGEGPPSVPPKAGGEGPPSVPPKAGREGPPSVPPKAGGEGMVRIFPWFLLYWLIVAMFAYGWAGEKMPWLVLHLALPTILLGAHFLGGLLDRTDWRALWERGAVRMAVLAPTFLLALFAFAGARPFQGTSIEDLNQTMRWIASLVLLILLAYWGYRLVRRLGPGRTARTLFFTLLAFLVVLTVRSALMASFIHGDIAKEMLIYTQTSPDVTMVMKEIDSISARLEGGKNLRIAYDNETSWPFEWYLRDYKNKMFFGAQPSTVLNNPVILVGLVNENKVKSYINTVQYDRRHYRLRWWFPEAYKNPAEWIRIVLPADQATAFLQAHPSPTFRDAARATLSRAGLRSVVRFFLYREGIPEPLGSTDFLMYVRKDVVAELWDIRSQAVAVEGPTLLEDTYSKRYREIASVRTWGRQGAGPGQLFNPKDIAVDAEGFFYVADSGNNRVQKFDPQGQLVTDWGVGGAADGQFQEPWGLAVDAEGNLYVADTWQHRIQKFDPQGKFVTMWGTFVETKDPAAETGKFWGPRDIAVDAEGNLYVTDTGNKRVQKFSPDGQFLGQWGGLGFGQGQFNEPVGIAISPKTGDIFVADTWNRRIQRFDKNFAFIAQWPIEGWESETVNNKPYIALDAKDADSAAGSGVGVYATDPENHRLLKFNDRGDLLAVWGKFGNDASSMNMPTGLAVDSEGNVYVTDSFNHRVMVFPAVN